MGVHKDRPKILCNVKYLKLFFFLHLPNAKMLSIFLKVEKKERRQEKPLEGNLNNFLQLLCFQFCSD